MGLKPLFSLGKLGNMPLFFGANWALRLYFIITCTNMQKTDEMWAMPLFSPYTHDCL